MTKSIITDPTIHAIIKTAPAAAPGIGTLLVGWFDIINSAASSVFMLLSIMFLLWRWRVAWVKDKSENNKK